MKTIHYLLRDGGYEYAYESEESCHLAGGESEYSTNKEVVNCKTGRQKFQIHSGSPEGEKK